MTPRSWSRLLAEAVAVVASILLAFAIDAWWDARGERADEAQAIANLRSEFRLNLLVLDGVAAHHRSSIAAGERLLAAASGADPMPSRPLLDSLIMTAAVDFVTFESNSSTLNDLLASGRLNLITNDTLRAALAAWPAAVEDVVEDQRLVVRFVETALLPYLSPRMATSDLYVAAAHAGYGSFPPTRSQVDLAALVRERELVSHLANRVAHERTVLDQVERQLRPLAQLIARHLGGGSTDP